MSQPVKLSDDLVLDARMAGKLTERSIAGQIEFWAKVGRAMEPLMMGIQVMALSRSGAAKPLSEVLDAVDTPDGRTRVMEHLQAQPFPHYEPAGRPGLLVHTSKDGTRTLGRFVNRQFRPVEDPEA